MFRKKNPADQKISRILLLLIGIWGHDSNSKDKDELDHVPSFLSPAKRCKRRD